MARPPKRCDTEAERGEARRNQFLEELKAGRSLDDACAAVGWKDRSSYRYHRRVYPQWGKRVDAVKRFKAGFDDGTLLDAIDTPSSFTGFVQKWFPERRAHQAQQLAIAEQLQQLRPREVCLFLLWPEAGKTATLEDWVTRKLTFDPRHRIRYVSEAQDLAKRVIGTVQRRMTDRSEYRPFIDRYGPFHQKNQEREGRPWAADQMMLLKNPGGERDRNLVASSWTSATYGSRIDTLVLDDLVSQRNYNQSERIFDVIRGTFFNRGIEMRTLIVGTRIGPGDFYERMLDAGLVTKQVIWSAQDADGEPRVPEFWDRNVFHDAGPCCQGFRLETCPNDGSRLSPKEFMQLIRHQSGEETWASSYMQNPNSNVLSTFSAYLDGCLDHDRAYGPLRRAS